MNLLLLANLLLLIWKGTLFVEATKLKKGAGTEDKYYDRFGGVNTFVFYGCLQWNGWWANDWLAPASGAVLFLGQPGKNLTFGRISSRSVFIAHWQVTFSTTTKLFSTTKLSSSTNRTHDYWCACFMAIKSQLLILDHHI